MTHWWSRSYTDWNRAVHYAHAKAAAVGVRQKVYWNPWVERWWVVAA